MRDETDRLYQSVLVLRCQAGDRAAFEELVALHLPRLRYFLQKMVRDAGRVEDLLQEVWFDVFRDIGRLTNPGAFRAWLYQVARHRVLRELRKRGQPICSLNGLDLPAPDEDSDEFSAEDAERVHAALDRLSPEHREVLLLRFIHDMSYEEIAGVTGCPPGTIRSRLHYGKRALHRAIEEMTPHE
jgi:RNA polymerase sigma-70 factor (ECF subfamily)